MYVRDGAATLNFINPHMVDNKKFESYGLYSNKCKVFYIHLSMTYVALSYVA